ncbi:hypothetical protein FGIG_02534 [Fasciola gigantica]|uniref:Uncharacterized protein n=1 Tax=Fasciola gigantica TaxID=46835 RepID=A0A504YB29_FASGI|nr:hypothetical protein FGIG_02534 [Fasciola gigantica]
MHELLAFSPVLHRNVLTCAVKSQNESSEETVNTIQLNLMQGAFRIEKTLPAWRDYLSGSLIHEFNRWMAFNTHTTKGITFSQIRLLVYEIQMKIDDIPSARRKSKYLGPWSKGLVSSGEKSI